MPDFAKARNRNYSRQSTATTKKPAETPNIPVNFHFSVSFLMKNNVNESFDIGFQKISGISAEIETDEIREGGENLLVQRVPRRVVYQNLILERGMIIGTPLSKNFDAAMTSLRFTPCNVLVVLLDHQSEPISDWTFYAAYPVSWTISDLDANANGLVIETMELAYSRSKSSKR